MGAIARVDGIALPVVSPQRTLVKSELGRLGVSTLIGGSLFASFACDGFSAAKTRKGRRDDRDAEGLAGRGTCHNACLRYT